MIPSIRELELEEKVARLLQRVHELESKQGPITGPFLLHVQSEFADEPNHACRL